MVYHRKSISLVIVNRDKRRKTTRLFHEIQEKQLMTLGTTHNCLRTSGVKAPTPQKAHCSHGDKTSKEIRETRVKKKETSFRHL